MAASPPETRPPLLFTLRCLACGRMGAFQGPDGTVWTPVTHWCEALGLESQAQRRRLGRHSWARVAMMATPAGDGPQLVCMDVHTLPLWLATIQVSRVKAEVREKLALYQREAAAVLASHFLGNGGAREASARLDRLEGAVERLAGLVEAQSRAAMGALPPGLSVADVQTRAMAAIEEWESVALTRHMGPISAWRLGPIIGVHQALVEHALMPLVREGVLHGATTRSGNGLEFSTPMDSGARRRPVRTFQDMEREIDNGG